MKIYYFFVFFFILFIDNSFEQLDENTCFKVKNYFWKHLATKTPYRYVANYDDKEVNFDGCVPQKIWAVIRHGTRYPNSKTILKMKERLPILQQLIIDNLQQKRVSLCAFDAKNISQWTPQVDEEHQKKLAHEGEDEMIELAERFQNKFPSLLKVDYSNSSFNFRFTATERVEKSKYYFTVGLFGRKVAHHVWSPEPMHKDPVLRFYKLCTKWRNEIKKNPKADKHSEVFKTSENIKDLIKNLSLRLGFAETLSFEDVELMYITCSYESAWNRVAPSVWCSVFSEEEMQAMEFISDLKHYWVDGYGYDINFKQACPMMVDMLQFFQSEGPTATFYFAHSATILKLLSHLGLYYDEFKLTHEKFNSPRLWKLSHIDAFGSNLAFVTFQCGDKLKLMTYHQERPVKLPGCPKDGLCLFDKFLKTYKQSFQNCQFAEICKV